jgi:hypothetical protein
MAVPTTHIIFPQVYNFQMLPIIDRRQFSMKTYPIKRNNNQRTVRYVNSSFDTVQSHVNSCKILQKIDW